MSKRPTKINWLFFYPVLLAPAVVTAFAAAGSSGGEPGSTAFALSIAGPLVGGPLAGLICGIYLARRVGQTSAERWRLGFLCVVGCICVSCMLTYFGCQVGSSL